MASKIACSVQSPLGEEVGLADDSVGEDVGLAEDSVGSGLDVSVGLAVWVGEAVVSLALSSEDEQAAVKASRPLAAMAPATRRLRRREMVVI